MTQQRHIEAAEKIVEDLIVNGGFVLQRYKSAKIIALAIAEAENRAAWDIHDVFFDVPDMRTYTSEKYGPRLEVKHE